MLTTRSRPATGPACTMRPAQAARTPVPRGAARARAAAATERAVGSEVARTHPTYGRIAAAPPDARESARSWCEVVTIRDASMVAAAGHGAGECRRRGFPHFSA